MKGESECWIVRERKGDGEGGSEGGEGCMGIEGWTQEGVNITNSKSPFIQSLLLCFSSQMEGGNTR